MSKAEAYFRKWFVESLIPLRSNGDAGFIFVFTAFPLLERYLRRKTLCPDDQKLTPRFFSELGTLFSDITGHENDFWQCYRNGLLHQATFPTAKLDKAGIWVSLPESGLSGHDPRPVYFMTKTNQFFLNPTSFYDTVTSEILSNFSTYEGSATPYHKLPSVVSAATAVPHTTPTIGVSLSTGSYKP